MGGCRCSYKNCQNTTKTTENVHFFHYPVKHKERCKIWIEMANKPQFCDLEEDQLRNKVICEYHFEEKWFPNSQKKRLLQGAIPTLDAGCEERLSESEMFVSTGVQDIQILPASSDGSLFILDTDSIYGRSQKVESFVYKNGLILPSTPPIYKQDKSKTATRPSTSKVIFPVQTCSYNNNHDQDMEDPPEFKVQIKSEADYDGQPMKILQKNGLEIVCEGSSNENENLELLNAQRRNLQGHKSSMVKNPINNKPTPEKPNLSKTYLRKIKQHSRDIACIKKMLRQKTMSTAKPDLETILKCLKNQLPPTFLTILNLNLNNKCELTEEDVDFFTTIHKVSPEVYQILVEKYRWNLPSVDIVDTPME